MYLELVLSLPCGFEGPFIEEDGGDARTLVDYGATAVLMVPASEAVDHRHGLRLFIRRQHEVSRPHLPIIFGSFKALDPWTWGAVRTTSSIIRRQPIYAENFVVPFLAMVEAGDDEWNSSRLRFQNFTGKLILGHVAEGHARDSRQDIKFR